MKEEGNKHGGETLNWNLEMAILQWINLIRFNKQINVLKTFVFCYISEKGITFFVVN